MEPINFMHTLSITEQKAVARWHRVSVWCFILLMTGIITAQCWQLYTFYSVYTVGAGAAPAHSQDNAILASHQHLKRQELLLHKQVEALKVLTKGTDFPGVHIRVFQQLLTPHMGIESCTMTPTTCQLILSCQKTEHAMDFIQKLGKQGSFKSVQLMGLQPVRTGYLATINGLIV
jgi:hypothetical protein